MNDVPDITPLFRQDLVDQGFTDEQVEELIAVGEHLGQKIKIELDIKKTQDEAIRILKEAGFGIIAPNGDCVANVGFFTDGTMALSTRKKPVYGMLAIHPQK